MTVDPVKYVETEVKLSILTDVVRVAKYHARHHTENTGHFSTPRQVFCYVDHLGYLAYGDNRSTSRSVQFIRDFFPPHYTPYAELLFSMWRHGTVHQLKPYTYRAPLKNGVSQQITVNWLSTNHNRKRERGQHMLFFPMEGKKNDVYLVVNSCQLADDLVVAVDAFISHLKSTPADRAECAKRVASLKDPSEYNDQKIGKQIIPKLLKQIRSAWRDKAGKLNQNGHITLWHPSDRTK